jgi:hypothetical protein
MIIGIVALVSGILDVLQFWFFGGHFLPPTERGDVTVSVASTKFALGMLGLIAGGCLRNLELRLEKLENLPNPSRDSRGEGI